MGGANRESKAGRCRGRIFLGIPCIPLIVVILIVLFLLLFNAPLGG